MSKKKRWLVRTIEHLPSLSYERLFLLWAGTVIICALIYTGLSFVPGEGPALAGHVGERFLSGLYFSVVTATTVGYGDILPIGLSRVFAATESFVGFFLFAVFIAKLMSYRQELALRDVHRIAFENTFHNIREDLHVVRQDFDRMITKASEARTLPEEEWDRLAVGYEQIANLVSEIPSLYGSAAHLYVIDERRENLLIEALHRTLKRVNKLLEVFTASEVPWIRDEVSVARLRELTSTVRSTLPLWRTSSIHHESEAFERLLVLTDSIDARIRESLPG